MLSTRSLSSEPKYTGTASALCAQHMKVRLCQAAPSGKQTAPPLVQQITLQDHMSHAILT